MRQLNSSIGEVGQVVQAVVATISCTIALECLPLATVCQLVVVPTTGGASTLTQAIPLGRHKCDIRVSCSFCDNINKFEAALHRQGLPHNVDIVQI